MFSSALSINVERVFLSIHTDTYGEAKKGLLSILSRFLPKKQKYRQNNH